MKKEYLRETYKEFRNCYTDDDFIKKADDLNISRETYYYDAHHMKTTDILDVLDCIDDDGSYGGIIEGCITIELHHAHGYLNVLEIPIVIYGYDWNEEEQYFDTETYYIKNVEEW